MMSLIVAVNAAHSDWPSSLGSVDSQHSGTFLPSMLQSLSDQCSLAILSQHLSHCCTRVRLSEPFSPQSSGAKTLINAFLHQIIKLLPSQLSSFQASDGTLQGFFSNTNPGCVLFLP